MIALGIAIVAAPAAAATLRMMPVPAERAVHGADTSSNSPTVTGEPFARAPGNDLWRAVRIEQRVIIRITPGDPALLRDLPLDIPVPPPVRLRERRMPKCVAVGGIAGVRPLSENRLLLILRDRRLVGADLARRCAARDFYMGFYVAPTPDGQLCVDRDTIHARNGMACTIARVRELTPAN